MFESVFEAIDEKIERLKTDIFLKNCEIERLRKENEELKKENDALRVDLEAERENAAAWLKEAERERGERLF